MKKKAKATKVTKPAKPKAPGVNWKALFKAIQALETMEDYETFFSDLCTPGELDSMADRWEVARLLHRGVPYREIYEQTGVSTATVTRVARALKSGEGGYSKILALTEGKGA